MDRLFDGLKFLEAQAVSDPEARYSVFQSDTRGPKLGMGELIDMVGKAMGLIWPRIYNDDMSWSDTEITVQPEQMRKAQKLLRSVIEELERP